MRNFLKSALHKASSPKVTADQQREVDQLLLRLAKIEFDWFQSKKEPSKDCQDGNRQDIGKDQNDEP